MLYLSLDLRVSDWDPATRSALVEVLRSPAGEVAPRRVRLDLNPDGQGERQLYDATNGQHLGQLLWESVFAGDIRDAWGRSYQAALDRRRGLRLRLHADDWRLAQLPWELLYDPARQEHLVYDRHLSLVRYARIPNPPPEPVSAERLTVLVVTAAPHDQPLLDWEREVSLLSSALQELVAQGRIAMAFCAHATAQRLQDSLMETRPEVVHYIGHGAYDPARQAGALLLEDSGGGAAPLEAHAIARLFCRYQTQLVFLNACDTGRGQSMGLAAALMRGDMPAVVAMQWPVEDEAAMQFSRAFYRAVSLDLTMDECMSEGRLAVSTAGGEPADWAAPVLYMRSLSGNLWVRGGAGRPAEASAEAVGAAGAPASLAFQTGGPLRAGQGDGVVLRRAELQRILKIARQSAVSQHIAIFGSQYSGKTTMLLQLMEELRAEHTCVYIDLALLHRADLSSCFRQIAFEVASQLEAGLSERRVTTIRRASGAQRRQSTAVNRLLSVQQAESIGSTADFIGLLHLMATVSPARRITLLLDQVDALPTEVAAGLLGALRTILVQARRHDGPLAKYLAIFTGGLAMQSLGAERNSPLNMAERIYLSDLDELQIAGILARFAQQGVPVSADAARLIHKATGGHPYLTMRLCAWLSHLRVTIVDGQAIAQAEANLLAADEHLDEVVRRVAADPAVDAKLRQILAGARLRFARSDQALAALELLGVIAPTTPVCLRNQIYETVLRDYALGKRRPGAAAGPSNGRRADQARTLTAQRHLAQLLVLAERGRYRSAQGEARWRTFAANLYAQMRGFSVSPRSLALDQALTLVLDIGEGAADAVWKPYRSGALVACRSLRGVDPRALVTELVVQAQDLGLELVFAMTHGGHGERAIAPIGGLCGSVMVVHVPHELLAQTLGEGADVESLLQGQLTLAQASKLER
jgi:hypothetical protein